MKKLALIFISAIYALQTNAQVIDGKVFTVFTAPYIDLSNPTILADSLGWDDPGYTAPLGFNFTLFGTSINNASALANQGIDGILTVGNSNPTNAVGLFVDYKNTRNTNHPTFTKSVIAYKTDTVAANKITKIEYNHVGMWEDTTDQEFLNMQTWFYEKDNALEYRIGPSQLDNDNFPLYFLGNGPNFIYTNGLDSVTQNWNKMYYISNITTPKLDSITLAEVFINNGFKGMPTFPDSGIVMRLAPPVAINVGLNETQLNDNITINTLVQNILQINLINVNTVYNTTLLDMNGKEVFRIAINQSNNSLNISHLAMGNYILCIANKEAKVFYKIAKQ